MANETVASSDFVSKTSFKPLRRFIRKNGSDILNLPTEWCVVLIVFTIVVGVCLCLKKASESLESEAAEE